VDGQISPRDTPVHPTIEALKERCGSPEIINIGPAFRTSTITIAKFCHPSSSQHAEPLFLSPSHQCHPSPSSPTGGSVVCAARMNLEPHHFTASTPSVFHKASSPIRSPIDRVGNTTVLKNPSTLSLAKIAALYSLGEVST
jgi:hypothetical protein